MSVCSANKNKRLNKLLAIGEWSSCRIVLVDSGTQATPCDCRFRGHDFQKGLVIFGVHNLRDIIGALIFRGRCSIRSGIEGRGGSFRRDTLLCETWNRDLLLSLVIKDAVTRLLACNPGFCACSVKTFLTTRPACHITCR